MNDLQQTELTPAVLPHHEAPLAPYSLFSGNISTATPGSHVRSQAQAIMGMSLSAIVCAASLTWMLAPPTSQIVPTTASLSVPAPHVMTSHFTAGGLGVLFSLGFGFLFGCRWYWPLAHADRVRNPDACEAIYDSLTGLPGRRLLLVLLRQALTRAESSGHAVAVLVVALEQFRPLPTSTVAPNLSLVVRVQAARIKSALHSHDTVARLDARSFAVIVDNLDSPDRAIPLAQRIQSAMALPLLIEGQELLLFCRIGGTVAPFDGADADRLLNDACQIISSRQDHDASIVFLSDPSSGSSHPHQPFGSGISESGPHRISLTATQ